MMHPQGKRPLVIGYGNPLRQDDGLGWRAAQLIEQSGAPAEVIICHQLAPELLLQLESAPLAVFLDAALDQTPGAIQVRPVTPESGWSRTHHLTPGQLLGLAEFIGQSSCPATLITGGAFETGASEQLTPGGERCAQQMAQRTIEILQNSLCAL